MPKRPGKCPYGVFDCQPDDLHTACEKCLDDAREDYVLMRAEQEADRGEGGY